jgi:MFS family permease
MLMPSSNRAGARLATRLAFLAAGFGVACWAPLVPFAKQRLGINDGILSLLLLCLGGGSVISMIAAGALSERYGAKPIIIVGGLGLGMALPLLSLAAKPLELACALLVLGAALGLIDVAMNVHAVEVERAAERPLMSGFHALYSIGGFVGATLMTFLLSSRMPVLVDTLLCSALIAATIGVSWPMLLTGTRGSVGPILVFPRGIVLLLAALAAVTYLVEGAMLDWSALLVSDKGLLAKHQAGLAYSLFAVAMTGGRLIGDRLTGRVGDGQTMVAGGILAIFGCALLLSAPNSLVALPGCLLIGFGESNIAPILFRRAGAQTAMSTTLAVAAITSAGYAGMLVGPVAIGFTASAVGLPQAFWILAGLMALAPFSAKFVTKMPSDV